MTRAVLLAALALAACNAPTPPSTVLADGGAVIPPVDGGAIPAADGGPADAGVPVVETTHEVTLRPPVIQPGQEKTYCVVVRLGNAELALARKIETSLSTGSHHLVVYRYSSRSGPLPEEQPTPFECDPFVEVARLRAVPIMISQSRREQIPLPENVVYELEPNQMVRIEAHYLNASTAPIQPEATVLFKTIPDNPDLHRAAFLFFGTPDIVLPPDGGTVTVGPRFIKNGFPDGAQIFAMTTHTHRLGTQFKVERAYGRVDPAAQPAGVMIYDYANWQWDDAPVKRFPDGGTTFAPGEGVRFTCEYKNTTNRRVTFGESATSEMCFLWLYYYPAPKPDPSDGFRICVDTDQEGIGELCCPGHFFCQFLDMAF